MVRKRFSEIGIDERFLGIRGVDKLEGLLDSWADVPLLHECGEEKVADRLMDLTLLHTYVFGRFLLPRYAKKVFSSLYAFGPLHDKMGEVVKKNIAFVAEELFSDNIFDGEGSHAHYWDMREACVAAGKDMSLVEEFEREQEGFYGQSNRSKLWEESMLDYVNTTLRIVNDPKKHHPLSTELIVVAFENTIAAGYETILKNLHASPKFDKFRRFMERHIGLDQSDGGHLSAVVDWFNIKYDNCSPLKVEAEIAVEDTIAVVEKRLETYKL